MGMKKISYKTLLDKLRPKSLPEIFEKAYEEWEGEGSFITAGDMESILPYYNLNEDKEHKLYQLLERLSGIEGVSDYIKFISWTQCNRRYDYSIDGKTSFNLRGIGDDGDAIEFFICLSCIIQSEKDLERRNIPKAYYSKIPDRMLSRQMEKYIKYGSLKVDDLPWSLNFYSHSIYLFDRFLFVPCKYDDIYDFYRNGKTVIGLTAKEVPVDDLGQMIDGDIVSTSSNDNGYYYGGYEENRVIKFTTHYAETESSVKGNLISPCGYITNETTQINKHEWKKVLGRDDWMIGFHIPEGEGYTPEHVRISMKSALDFFRNYYPEIEFKGFWSASWLYDGRLSLFLCEDSNIVKVQRQFFNYSGGWNGEMSYTELFGDCKLQIDEVPQKTSLQRKVVNFLKHGGRLCETGMVYFPEELAKSYDEMIYITSDDLIKQSELFERKGWKELSYETGI